MNAGRANQRKSASANQPAQTRRKGASMKILCIGGGPAGLYFAISAKRRDAAHDITVIERDPPGATYGLGVVYWDSLLDMLFSNGMESARHIRAASRLARAGDPPR
jgi:anthraniloyl-CoA monooxygenase